VGTKVTLLDEACFDSADPISMKDLPRSEIYTVAQAARMLSISVGTVYQLLREGAIPAKRLGRRWVIPRRRFHVWLDALDQERV
jgi:excisionase family DNA binding protein